MSSPKALFQLECNFVAGAVSEETLPYLQKLPEICFAGRSNVGKSSLLNSLVNKKDLARVSNTPGRTQQLNFFNLGNKLVIVDLPGYGYAKVSKKDRNAWQIMIRKYLLGRIELKRIFLLIDAVAGIKSADEEIMKVLDQASVSYQIIVTKVDKAKKDELESTQAQIASIMNKHAALHPHIFLSSSREKLGLTEIKVEIFNLINQ